ncbi:MAG: GrpB family protein [Cyanosarcina radialis HA8281-LM2]|jgi:GrpB-like predicted nucleotidyltransferase (UPF0157 family)|nr:GrpB family protein [Cyanosarcina radialis HA8281-LM2]
MDRVVIAPYDRLWPVLFDREAARIREVLDRDLVTRIEHFGSTAVPGLAAKPIIDLLVGVRWRSLFWKNVSLVEAKQVAISQLKSLGYDYWCDNPDPQRMFFVKGLPPNGPRTHHIHIVEPDSLLWERLLFRDYLRQHPEEATRYARLKCDLARRYATDREAYTSGKAEYIESVMPAARESVKPIRT